MFEVRRTLALRLAARFVMVLALVLAGGACTPGKPAATPSAAELEALRPADARLAAIYERACMLCHARVGSVEWTERTGGAHCDTGQRA